SGTLRLHGATLPVSAQRFDNLGAVSSGLSQKNRVFNLSVKSLVMRNDDHFLESSALLRRKHGFFHLFPTFGVNPVSGLIEDTESQPAELLNHCQGHGQRKLCLLSAG